MSHVSGQADSHNTTEVLMPSTRWGSDVPVDCVRIGENLADIQTKVAPCKPRIIAVTKYYGLDAVVNGYEAGLRDFGESRAIEAIEKIKALPSEVRENSVFHFIGHLQTNKAEKVVEYFDYIHSVDSLKVAGAISRAACRLNKREKILLQVNIAGEEQKSGYSVGQLAADFPEIMNMESVEICGLMAMAPLNASDDELHRLFGSVRILRDELRVKSGCGLPELSMGMSNDFGIAVEEGATIIRIGRKLFK